MPKNFSTGIIASGSDLSMHFWWNSFNDPLLGELVLRGLGANLSIKQAQERIIAARALASGAGVNDSGDATSSLERQKEAEGEPETRFGIGLGVSWIIDLFGRSRQERLAAANNLQAANADAELTKLLFVSELVAAYIDLRFYETSVYLKQLDLSSRRQTVSQTSRMMQLGNATQLEMSQAEALLSSTMSEIPALEANVRRQLNRIATLLGVPAGTLAIPGSQMQPLPAVAVPTGVPADLVRNRPDVRRAEYEYAAAFARMGIARADLYPSLMLNGAISARAVNGNGSTSWSFGPSVTLPVFGRQRLLSNLSAAESDARRAELAWQQAVLTAVEEVENALYGINRYNSAVISARETVNHYNKSLNMSRKILQNNNTTNLELINVERQISDARETLAESQRRAALEYIALNVALGAGYGMDSIAQAAALISY